MVIDKIALTLAIIGALNWGSVGLFGFDCVAFLFVYLFNGHRASGRALPARVHPDFQ